MALSGSFTGTTNNQYIRPTITWSASQSIDGNYSDVTATLTYSRTNSGYTTSGAWSGSLTINGDTRSAAQRVSITQNSNTAVMTHTVRVPHNADGTKSVTISAAGGIPGTSFTSTSVSAEIALDTIPRASAMTISGSTLGSPVTFRISSASSAFTHSLTYQFGGASGTLLSYVPAGERSWTPPLELAREIPDAPSGVGTFTLYTWAGEGVSVGVRSYPFTLNVPSGLGPEISGLAVSEATAGLAAQFGAYVQHKSTLKVEVTAAGVCGSTIKTCQVSADGRSYSGTSITTAALTASGELPIKVTVTDSRGRSASRTVSVEVLPYANPAITGFTAYRCGRDGSAAADGNYVSLTYAYRVSPVGGKNTAAMEAACKRLSAAENAWAALLAGTDYTASATVVPATAISADYQWHLRLKVSDWFTSTQMVLTLPSAEVILDLLSDGKGVAFGKTAEESGVLEAAWPVRFRKNLEVDGGLEVANSLSVAEVNIGGSELADFIVAKSINADNSTSWSWVKYASGLAMCWGRRNVCGNFDNQAWGALYVGGEMGSIAYPFSFAGIPFCWAARSSADTADYNNMFTMISSTGGSSTATPKFELVRGSTGTIGHPYVTIFAVGRWK